jgi:hypothetical protein
MAGTTKPKSLTLRTYNVGFGDCFLLSFHYRAEDRHVLIDFGSTGIKRRKEGIDGVLLGVANDIATACVPADGTRGKLHAIVATHRHKDHISGFATKKGGNGPGDIIRKLTPDVVIQPWTEDPNAAPNATNATRLSYGSDRQRIQGFISALQSMHQVSARIRENIQSGNMAFGQKLAAELRFIALGNLGEHDLANRSAIENLRAMGRKHFYVHHGSPSGLESVLPHVKVTVLGPPTLEQSDEIRTQRSRDADEFWQFTQFWGLHRLIAAAPSSRAARALFPNTNTYRPEQEPPYTRWLLDRIRKIEGEQLLSIVRALDQAMNNTSVILLFEVGKEKLLFPGDAQIENWAYALSKPKLRKLLEKVTLYKVGHHGSLNATPKSLWALFSQKDENDGPRRLRTRLSTMPGKHGSTERGTEVPRQTLFRELQRESDLFSTHQMKTKDGWCHKDEIIF